MPHGHEKADERNLALHRLALRKWKDDPQAAKEKVLAVLDRWGTMPHLQGQAALLKRWRTMLDLPVRELEAAILGESGQQLRQASPLGVLISPKERFLVYRELAGTGRRQERTPCA